MKGYAYLDLDNNVVYRVASYIDEDNPGFFAQNSHLIIKHWKFDTDNSSSMLVLFRNLNDLAVPNTKVKIFIDCIGYDMKKLKDASKV